MLFPEFCFKAKKDHLINESFVKLHLFLIIIFKKTKKKVQFKRQNPLTLNKKK